MRSLTESRSTTRTAAIWPISSLRPGFRNGRRHVLIGNRPHRSLQPLDRTNDATHDGESRKQNDQRGECADDGDLDQAFGKHGGQVVGIDAGADDPAPGRKSRHMRIFQHRLLGAGLRPVIIDEPLALGGNLFGKLDEDALAGRILVLRLVGAIKGRLDRVHDHHALHVGDEEIAAILIAHRLDRLDGARLRVVAAQRAGLFLLVIGIEHGHRVLVHRLQHGLALRYQLVLFLEQPQRHHGRHHQKRQPHQRIQAHGNTEMFHTANPPQIYGRTIPSGIFELPNRIPLKLRIADLPFVHSGVLKHKAGIFATGVFSDRGSSGYIAANGER